MRLPTRPIIWLHSKIQKFSKLIPQFNHFMMDCTHHRKPLSGLPHYLFRALWWRQHCSDKAHTNTIYQPIKSTWNNRILLIPTPPLRTHIRPYVTLSPEGSQRRKKVKGIQWLSHHSWPIKIQSLQCNSCTHWFPINIFYQMEITSICLNTPKWKSDKRIKINGWKKTKFWTAMQNQSWTFQRHIRKHAFIKSHSNRSIVSLVAVQSWKANKCIFR